MAICLFTDQHGQRRSTIYEPLKTALTIVEVGGDDTKAMKLRKLTPPSPPSPPPNLLIDGGTVQSVSRLALLPLQSLPRAARGDNPPHPHNLPPGAPGYASSGQGDDAGTWPAARPRGWSVQQAQALQAEAPIWT